MKSLFDAFYSIWDAGKKIILNLVGPVLPYANTIENIGYSATVVGLLSIFFSLPYGFVLTCLGLITAAGGSTLIKLNLNNEKATLRPIARDKTEIQIEVEQKVAVQLQGVMNHVERMTAAHNVEKQRIDDLLNDLPNIIAART